MILYDYRGQRAFYRTMGFIRAEGGLYEEFEEVLVEAVFETDEVKRLLLKVGFSDAYFALSKDLGAPVSDPENENRIFTVATRG